MKKKTPIIILAIVITIALLVVNAIFINPHTTKVRQETITSNKIGKSLDNTLIAYFSDLKYAKETLDITTRAIDNINAFKPDLILFGGDLLRTDYKLTEEETNMLIELLASLKAPLGKYAVLGDEDNREDVRKIIEDSGFVILDNRSVKIYNGSSYLELVGLENMINGQKDLAKAYADVNSGSFILTLSHCPDSIEEISSYPSDYFLAGHSLGGSIYIPIFNSFYRFKGAEKHFHGSDIINGTYLEITNGVGLGKSKARLFADSEIVLYKLSSAS
ncbi:MAG: hypothetical protein PUD22_07285 [Erysipelotrichaceae bacterium]|nr:hypothetical protein [Erysipelotrichaceae bacterium]